MEVQITPVSGKSDLERFLDVPYNVFKDDPHWVAPLRMEMRKRLTPGKNPYFDHAEAKYWLAWHGDQPVGRISAQIDQLVLEHQKQRIGHFGFLDAIDDEAVFSSLLAVAEEWLRSRGMTASRGPFNLSVNEECGLLVEGFDTPPFIMMGHARPYYRNHLQQCGYSGAKDLFAYILEETHGFPGRIIKLYERAIDRGQFFLRKLDKRHYDRDLSDIIDIFNDAWSGNWGFLPITEAEAEQAAADMKPLIIPDLVQIADIDGEPAAMMITLPNINELIADLDGKLVPFGWAKLIWRLKVKKASTARVVMMGVRQKYQNTPLGAAMAFALIETSRRLGFEQYGIRRGELSWILEDNTGMRDMLEAIDSKIYKTYRIYEKNL